jgi:hypothetical protein
MIEFISYLLMFIFRSIKKEMFILSDLYRGAINVGERVLTPGMKKVFYTLVFVFHSFLFI